jgi:hypothetical protein
MASKHPSKQHVEELQVEAPSTMAAPGAGDVVEYNPDVPADFGGLSVQAASLNDPGTLLPSDEQLSARDELLARLANFSAVASALSFGVEFGETGVENIQGIGIGLKEAAGTYTGEIAVKVFVREKVPESRLQANAAVPSEVNGIATDVEEVGDLIAQSYASRFPRAVPCGVSCGHPTITAGTIGALVVLNNNRLAILSNNHVLANENIAQVGNPILQPGRLDGGQNPADRIAILERFTPLQFPGPNLVDAAVAWTAFSLVKPDHVTYRVNPTPLGASISLSVMKNGRTTQATQGLIVGIAVNSVSVGYGSGVAVFNNQLVIRGIGSKPFSQGGDSGSLIVSVGSRQPVGLLFAGSATHTIANPISSVISAMGISRFV